jgi:glycosyltransferase involved in cell wall biosynthesis
MEQHIGHRSYYANLRSAVDARSGLDVAWIPITYGDTGRWWDSLPLGSLRGPLRGAAEVRRGLRGANADVYVFNTQVPAALGGRVVRKRPYVVCTDVTPVQYDDMAAGYEHRPDRFPPLKWLKHRWNRSVLRAASAHAPWSAWVRQSLIDDYGVDPGRVEVIPPGVDLTRWTPAAHNDGRTKILFVGGDFRRKGGDLLLGAFAKLRSHDAELRIVTKSLVERHDRVTVFSDLDQNDARLIELYRTSDIFVLPSRSETFGISAVEAGAAGLPVVVSAVGGLADLVVDGTTGFAVPPDDPTALVESLERLVTDRALRRAMGAAARRRVERKFDASVNAERLVRLAVAAAATG